MVLDAIRKAGVRAIVQGWTDILREMDALPSVYCAGSMPHDWLFDQVSAVVLHGGFGTTAAVLRAGGPAIVIPHVIDQFYWGQCVYELGVGPKFISRAKLTSDKLSQVITQALADSTILEKAAHLGTSIRAEPDGVTHAIQYIEKVFNPV